MTQKVAETVPAFLGAIREDLKGIAFEGEAYKEARRILLAPLSGNKAFRTPENEAEFRRRQRERRVMSGKKVQVGRSRMLEELARPTWEAASAGPKEKTVERRAETR